jgi:2-dehydropantoate 2-reductase
MHKCAEYKSTVLKTNHETTEFGKHKNLSIIFFVFLFFRAFVMNKSLILEEIMEDKMAVLGTGAIGSSVGADLTKAGYDVMLIDQWPAHVEAMKANGLRVTMTDEDLHTTVNAIHICELATLTDPFDIVFLTAKSYDSCWMTELIRPYLKPGGALVSLQNSLNDELIAPIIGPTRDVGCVVELSAEVFEPAKVKRNTTHAGTWFAVGELHGRITPRAEKLAEILSCVGKTDITTNIWGAKWTKLIANCMLQAPIGVLGLYEKEATDIPEVFDFCIQLGREAMEVGATLGYTIEAIYGLSAEEFMGSTDEVLKKNLRTLVSHMGKEARNSVLQDHLKGRYSEVDQLNGLVVKKGKEAGVPTPLNEAITTVTKQIQKGDLKPDRSNLQLLKMLMDENRL